MDINECKYYPLKILNIKTKNKIEYILTGLTKNIFPVIFKNRMLPKCPKQKLKASLKKKTHRTHIKPTKVDVLVGYNYQIHSSKGAFETKWA